MHYGAIYLYVYIYVHTHGTITKLKLKTDKSKNKKNVKNQPLFRLIKFHILSIINVWNIVPLLLNIYKFPCEE